MSFEVEGKLHKVFETEQKTESFRTREFILEIEQGAYPQLVKFQLVQDRTDIIDPYQEGDKIRVYFDLRGREWNGKYFTNLSAWRLEAAEETAPGQASLDSDETGASGDPAGSLSDAESNMRAEDFDDLPF